MAEHDSTTDLTGRCHCGAMAIRVRTTRAAHDLGARACGCSYCRPRRMRWTSDPQGLAEIEVAQEAQLSRYRFGTSTAEFLVCRGCGYLMAAVSDGEPRRCVINVDVLAQADAFSESTAANFDGEGVDDRLARRSRTWTPVRLTVGLPG